MVPAENGGAQSKIDSLSPSREGEASQSSCGNKEDYVDEEEILEEEEEENISFSEKAIGRERVEESKRILSLTAKWGIRLGVVIFTFVAVVSDFRRALPLLVVELIYLFYQIVFRRSYVEYFGWNESEVEIQQQQQEQRQNSEQVVEIQNSSHGDGIQERNYHFPFFHFSSETVEQLRKGTKIFVALISVFIVLLYITLSLVDDIYRIQSLLGLILIPFSCAILSVSSNKVDPRQVFGGLFLQIFWGILLLKLGVGLAAISYLGDVIVGVLGHLNVGVEFVFGTTVPSLAPFGFIVLPTIAFFSSLASILHYLGVLPALIQMIGRLMQLNASVTSAEAMGVAANIFIGMSEAPLALRSLLPHMSSSELHVLMSGGFATISGSVLAAYIEMGVYPPFLLAASAMAAPGALALSKLIFPEISTRNSNLVLEKPSLDLEGEERPINIFGAAFNGAVAAIPVLANVAIMIICFISLFSLLDGILNFLGSLVDIPDLSLELIFGYVFFPVAFIMGTPLQDCHTVGILLTIKLFLNEFVAYEKMVEMRSEGILTGKADVIATFSICGFANFASVGIQLGVLSSLLPNQKKSLTELVVTALYCGYCTSLVSASIACLLGVETTVDEVR